MNITIDGSRKNQRYAVMISGQRVYLTPVSFRYLAGLAYGRVARKDGWIPKYDIDRGYNQGRYIYVLRKELAKQGIILTLENDHTSNYRLSDDCKVSFNFERLKGFPHHDVVTWAAEVKGKMSWAAERERVS